MEDTLRDVSLINFRRLKEVLILVLMEDTLRAGTPTVIANAEVLILVLMEDTLRER